MAAARTGSTRQYPSHNLPIATNPASPAAHVGAVARGIFLVQLHVAQQARVRVTPFQKIVAEDPVLGKPPFQRPLERIDIVNPFANERALTEYILVNIRNSPRIRVDAWRTPPQSRIPR